MLLLELLLLISFQISGVFTFENVLDNSLYNIKWQDSIDFKNELYPVPSDRVSVVMRTNKNEKYQCLLPTNKHRHLNNKEEESSGVKLELELLGSLIKSSICSYRIETYWSYELCQGKTVRQFHEHLKVPPSTQQYFLGNYSREKYEADLLKARVERQLGTETKIVRRKKVFGMELPYYQVTYTEGTVCDLTGKARQTHVQYVCHEDSGGELYDIKETSSCEYEAVVLTKDLCEHPIYGTKKSKTQAIECHPLVRTQSLPSNLNQLLKEGRESRYEHHKSRLVDSLWDVVYQLADEEDEEEIKKIESKTLGSFKGDDDDKTDIPQQQQQHKPDTSQQQKQFPQQEEEKSKQQPPQQKSKQQESQPQQPQQKSPQQQLPDIAYKNILHSFLSGEQCISGGSGWWKHEICYKRFVKQFHQGQGEEGRSEIMLGRWKEEGHLEWTKHTNKKTKHTTGRKFIYNYYSEGDTCEESGRKRVVAVRFECLDASSKGIMIYILEPSVCVYELVVQSYMFCDVINTAHSNGLINYP